MSGCAYLLLSYCPFLSELSNINVSDHQSVQWTQAFQWGFHLSESEYQWFLMGQLVHKTHVIVIEAKKQKSTGLVHSTALITDWTISLYGWSKCGNLFELFWRKWRSRCPVQPLSHWTRRIKRSVINFWLLLQKRLEQRNCWLLLPFDHQLCYSATNNPFTFICSCCLHALFFCMYAHLTWKYLKKAVQKKAMPLSVV